MRVTYNLIALAGQPRTQQINDLIFPHFDFPSVVGRLADMIGACGFTRKRPYGVGLVSGRQPD
jgi:hypothetical protein